MKVDKIATPTVETNIEITGVTLLSKEEYEVYMDRVPVENGWWWVRRSSNSTSKYPVIVIKDDSLDYIFENPVHMENGIRPVLRISNLESSNLQIMDKFSLGNYMWTVISEDIALCDSIIGHSPFRKDFEASDADAYEASDIKKWLDSWVKEKRIELVK